MYSIIVPGAVTATTSHGINAKFQASSVSTGIITTVAGYKIEDEGETADGIPATSFQLILPQAVVLDNAGNFSSLAKLRS